MFTTNPLTLLPPKANDTDSQPPIRLADLPTPLIKLTDFGLARFTLARDPTLRTRCGSESFTAPEIIMGQAYDGRNTDSWAVGVILYAMVTGELPFDRMAAAQQQQQHVSGSSSNSSTANQPGSPMRRPMDDETFRRKRIMAIAKSAYQFPPFPAPPVSPGAQAVIQRLLVRDPVKRTRVGPDLWDREVWMHGPGGVARPGTNIDPLPVNEDGHGQDDRDARTRLLDGWLIDKDEIELEAARDTY